MDRVLTCHLTTNGTPWTAHIYRRDDGTFVVFDDAQPPWADRLNPEPFATLAAAESWLDEVDRS